MTSRARRFISAQLVTTAALGALGQFLTGSGQTYFGPPDAITLTGVLYLGAATLFLGAGLLALWRRHPAARGVALLLPALNIAAFVQPILASPAVAGVILLWNLWLVGSLLAPTPQAAATKDRRARSDPEGNWLASWGPAARHLLWMSTLLSVVIVGFERTDSPVVAYACAGLALLALGVNAGFAWLRVRDGSAWPWLALLLLLGGLAWGGAPDGALLGAAAAQAILLVQQAARDTTFTGLRAAFFEHPALLIVVSFLVLIAFGTLLLSFPAASTRPGSIGIVDAAFTATSAACVTGLIVLDTPVDFTPFGQSVILLLIQVGGLNIMVLSTFGALLLGRGLGLHGERALGEILDVETPETAYRLIAFIVAATLAAEAIGALVLGGAYLRRGVALAEAAWLGVFHAVSAFCNAGFALHSDSLVRFQESPLVLLTFAALITAGGLGFVVLARFLPWSRTREVSVLQTHARLVLVASLVLVVVGTGLFAAGEWNRTLTDLPLLDRVVNALFQSVTLRTAGFNSVPTDATAPGTTMWMMVFMFVGASPGGTGGGIKTTTAAVLLAAIPAIVRGGTHAVLGRRTVSLDAVYRSAAIVTAFTLAVVTGGVLLLATQQGSFQSLLFEAFSAMGTVGLSLGATGSLDAFGKTVVMAMMLLGRVGPLSVALLLGRRLASRIAYPEARILVG